MMTDNADDLDDYFEKIERNAHSDRAKQLADAEHQHERAPSSIYQQVELVDMKTAARIVTSQRKKEIGRNTLYKLLRDQGMLIANNSPRVMYIPRFFKPVLTSYETGEGIHHYAYKTLVTAQGIALICELLDTLEALEAQQPTPPPNTNGENPCH